MKIYRYITLLQRYNKLENEYKILKTAVANECFKEIYSKIATPELIEEKDKEIERLKKQVRKLKEDK